MKLTFSYPHLAVTAVLFLMMGFLSFPVLAEETGDAAESSAHVSAETSVPQNTALQEKIARWKELREKDPQAFEQKIKEHKETLKGNLQSFQRKNPEKFEQFKEQFVQRRQERMQNLQKENPEKFQQVMKNREQRLERWKEKNPEKYNQFVQNHPKIREQMQKRENRMREQGGNLPGQEYSKTQEETKRIRDKRYENGTSSPQDFRRDLQDRSSRTNPSERTGAIEARNGLVPSQGEAPRTEAQDLKAVERNHSAQNFQQRREGFRNPGERVNAQGSRPESFGTQMRTERNGRPSGTQGGGFNPRQSQNQGQRNQGRAPSSVPGNKRRG